MQALKVTSLVFISLLLFINLNLFGFLLTVDRTILNPDFVTGHLEKLELYPVFESAIADSSGGDFPLEMADSALKAAGSLEPELKTNLGVAIYSTYDYLRGKKANPELTSLVRYNLLGDHFISSVIDELDIAVIARVLFEESLAEAVPQELALFGRLPEAVETALEENEEYLKTQLKAAAGTIADYVTGAIDWFSVEIDITRVIQSLKAPLYEAFVKLPPGFLQDEIVEIITREFDRLFDEFTAEIPHVVQIDEQLIGSDIPAQVTRAITDAEKALTEARQAVRTFQIVFILTAVVIVLAAGLIILIHRKVTGAALNLGVILLFSGLLASTTAVFGRNVVASQIQQAGEAPQQINVWVSQVLGSAFAPLLWLGVGYLATGALLIAAFFYTRYRERYINGVPE